MTFDAAIGVEQTRHENGRPRPREILVRLVLSTGMPLTCMTRVPVSARTVSTVATDAARAAVILLLASVISRTTRRAHWCTRHDPIVSALPRARHAAAGEFNDNNTFVRALS